MARCTTSMSSGEARIEPGRGGLTAPAVVLDEVTISLGGRQLFSGLSLVFDGGRTTCILGPSGCGKSTLLRLVAGIGPPLLRGRVAVSGMGGGPCPCAWMGQEDMLLPWLSLHDNLLLGATLRGQRDREAEGQARLLLARAGLAEAGDSLPAQLSGGMRQRGALLRTLLEDRPVVLMDEPFSALDALTRQRLQDLAAGLIGGRTVLLVTHDPLEALRLADDIVIFAGSPAMVVARLQPPGRPPRAVGEGEMARLHGHLLSLLMGGGQP